MMATVLRSMYRSSLGSTLFGRATVTQILTNQPSARAQSEAAQNPTEIDWTEQIARAKKSVEESQRLQDALPFQNRVLLSGLMYNCRLLNGEKADFVVFNLFRSSRGGSRQTFPVIGFNQEHLDMQQDGLLYDGRLVLVEGYLKMRLFEAGTEHWATKTKREHDEHQLSLIANKLHLFERGPDTKPETKDKGNEEKVID